MNVVNVLIVTYNSAKTIKDCINSLQDILPKKSLIAVWDNNSSDDAVSIIKSNYPAIKYYRSTENIGFGAAINKLVDKHKDASWYFILNPDSKVAFNDFNDILFQIKMDPSISLWGSSIITSKGKINPSAFMFPSLLEDMAKLYELNLLLNQSIKKNISKIFNIFGIKNIGYYDDAFKRKNTGYDWVSGTALLISSKVLMEGKIFDPGYFLYHEDVDLCYRLKKGGYNIKIMPDLKIIHDGYGSSSYKSPFRILCELKGVGYYRYKYSSRIVKWFIGFLYLTKMILILIGFSRLSGKGNINNCKSILRTAKLLLS